tara:strand:- start:3395 stop:4063 length:669 start_codon:yes stop_codon:yes gene_type:complete
MKNSSQNCLANKHYTVFDNVVTKELLTDTRLIDITTNKIKECLIQEWEINDELLLKTYQQLHSWKDKRGIYIFWRMDDKSDDCKENIFIAEYVGQGTVVNRVIDHLTGTDEKLPKWIRPYPPFITFFECELRIAKYYEHLLLETYKFELNFQQNSGTLDLYRHVKENDLLSGSETDKNADLFTRINHNSGNEFLYKEEMDQEQLKQAEDDTKLAIKILFDDN